MLKQFAGKIQYWASRIAVRLMRLSKNKNLHIPSDRPVISFTFDDVPESALSLGADILENHGVRGTFYIAGSLFTQVEEVRRQKYREGVRDLARRGHEIGEHTYSHHHMSLLSKKKIIADAEKNAAYLNALLANVPGKTGADHAQSSVHSRRNFAYPYNAVSFIARKVMAGQYRSCRAGENRINRGAVNPVMLYGMEIGQPEDTALKLTSQIDALMREPGWLIFFTHDISEQPSDYGCTPQTFTRLVQYALENGCDILPVNAALDRFAAQEK